MTPLIIRFLSASDRNNYGDLLFPQIFLRYVQQERRDVEFFNYGLVKSDLSGFGALPTRSYRALIADLNKDGGQLIIGGGEVFFADWRKLYSFINPFYAKLLNLRSVALLEDYVNVACWLLSRNKVTFPFCPAPEELVTGGKVPIFYNAVGGQFTSQKVPDLKRRLLAAQYVSVRDDRTYSSLMAQGVCVELVPDSAILMANLFHEEIRQAEKNINLENLGISSRYIFVQMGRSKAPKMIDLFAQELEVLAKELSAHVLLCPIGQAPGHEDHTILREIARIKHRFVLYWPCSIFEIMYLISKATMYIGTSLHGMITAQSFNVPFAGLNPRVKKLDSYIRTWADDHSRCLQFEQLSEASEIYSRWDFNKMAEITSRQKILASDNIRKILDWEQ